jgi:hypothetical protein
MGSRNIFLEDELMDEMKEEKFWNFIEYTKKISDDKEKQIELIIEILSEREMNEIIRFEVLKNYFHDLSIYIKIVGCCILS